MKLILSRNPERASSALYGQIKESLEKGRRAFLVVPSQFTLEAEQALFDFLGTEVLMKAQVKSFDSLERDILERAGGLSKPSISSRGMRMLIRFLISKSDQMKELFSENSSGKGLSERILNALVEWQNYAILPDQLMEMAGYFPENDHSAKKFSALAGLYKEYKDRIKDDFYDPDSQSRKTFDFLDKEDFFINTDFFFDRFNSMSGLERYQMKKLSQDHSISMALSMEYDLASAILKDKKAGSDFYYYDKVIERIEDRDAFSFPAKFIDTLADDFPSMDLLKADKILDVSQNSAKLQHRDLKEKPEDGSLFSREGQYEFYSYNSVEDEVLNTLIEIRKIREREGLNWDDFLIYLADPEEYGRIIEKVFAVEGVPFFYDRVKAGFYHPLIQTISAFLLLQKKSWGRLPIMLFLKSGLTGLDPDKIDTYQNFIVRRKIKYDMFLQEKYFSLDPKYLPKDSEKATALKEEFETANYINRELLALLNPFTFKEKDKIINYCKKIYDFISQDRIAGSFVDYGRELERQNREEDRSRHRQIWDKFISLLDELVDLLGEEEISKDLFCLILEEGLESIKAAVIPPFKNQIFIADIKRSRVRGRKYTFVLGSSAEALPSAIEDSGILTNEEKELLSSRGNYLPSMPAFNIEEEAYNFYLLYMRNREKMRFSYSLTNLKNESREESPVTGLLRERMHKEVKSGEREPDDIFYSRQILFDSLAMYLHSSIKDKNMEQIIDYFSQEDSENKFYKIFKETENFKKDKEALKKDVLQKLYPSRNISVSQLQTLALCPYRHFIDYAIKPEEPEELDINALDIGNIMHLSLKEWSEEDPQKIRDLGAELSLEKLKDKFELIKDKDLDNLRRENLKNKFILKRTEKTLRESHAKLFDRIIHSKIYKSQSEQAFYKGGPLEGLELNLSGGSKFYLQGIIDRIDYIKTPEGDYAQVLDYKTGKNYFDISSTMNGSLLQLPLYLKVTENLAKAAGALYMPIRALTRIKPDKLKEGDISGGKADEIGLLDEKDKLSGFILGSEIGRLFDARLADKYKESLYSFDGRKGNVMEKDNVLSKEEMDKLLDQAQKEAEKLASIRQKGLIDVKPLYIKDNKVSGDNSGTCRFCPYNSLCHFEISLDYGKQRIEDRINWGQWRESLSSGKGDKE